MTDAELEALENEDLEAQLSEMGIRTDISRMDLEMVLSRAEARLGWEFTTEEREEKSRIRSLLIPSDFEHVDEVSITHFALGPSAIVF